MFHAEMGKLLYAASIFVTWSLNWHHLYSFLHKHSSFSFYQKPLLTYGLTEPGRETVLHQAILSFSSLAPRYPSPQISI